MTANTSEPGFGCGTFLGIGLFSFCFYFWNEARMDDQNRNTLWFGILALLSVLGTVVWCTSKIMERRKRRK